MGGILAMLIRLREADFGHAMPSCHRPLFYFDRFEDQAKTKVLCTQHTKKTTAGPFHFLYMAPMSDVTML
jgi:hypothetical protein